MSPIETLNQTFFLMLNGSAESPAWLLSSAKFAADYLILMIPALLLGFWLWGSHQHRNAALKACAVTFLALGFGQIITMLWPHPRPFMIGLGHAWIAHAADPSFPSDHMTVFVGVGLTLLLEGFLTRAAITLLAGLIVAWARIYLGVHFPLDMVGAVAVAGMALAAISPLWCRKGSELTQLIEQFYRFLLAKPIAMGWIRR
ncbi:phosphatase PAP2 family protein [Chromobacterium violaceum]|uniref:phosphatase PAP2 family protein n=1 Tax=Chromobacterium violaceum TaxID=536 RepID=UPI0009DB05B0|nr:phosphatase PAP2 family protein [Chromobacterium violaceum]OQS20250.1 undecaprenyl-diphosphatase [Chromobacterium violaceum]